MNNARQLIIKEIPFTGTAVVYVMARDQRIHDNHALLAAQALAVEHSVPLYVLFVTKKVNGRSREHYQFMIEGLNELSQSLKQFGIPFIMRTGNAFDEVTFFAKEVQAGALFFDFNPLQGSRALIKKVAEAFNGQIRVVDTHNIIPTWIASDKQEFAAHTMRTKVYKKLQQFLTVPDKLQKQTAPKLAIHSISDDEIEAFLKTIPKSGIKVAFASGEMAAHSQLQTFIEDDLKAYAQARNNIAKDQQSGLSPYLHFGQISSLRVALEVIGAVNEPPLLFQQAKLAQPGDTPSAIDGMNALLEEMIVRKELSDNFCFYKPEYRSLTAAADWAQKTLSEHASDPRDFVYTTEEWESAATHDEVWNASQTELKKTGKIHGYMRMYWAKKMLEWSATPAEALQTAIYLNDKYSIDGGDPNGYVGILWSIAGLHDRPWFERSVYGKIRYMNASGLRRKFDVDTYISRVNSL